MFKFKLYTFYKADGTSQSLYGTDAVSAMDSAGWNLDYIAENIRDYREGDDNSLEFINGKWYSKELESFYQ